MADASTSAKGDLKLTNITKSFGDFKAVDDLTLTIPEGSFFALLGPSGCGKTTTLRMIAGLEDPTSGKISIGSTDITNKRPYQRPVNTVFQNYALFPHLTIFENIAFGLRRRGIKDVKEQVDKVLNLVELPHLADRKPTQLSGGQQQRIAVARAIVNRPALLLLDEPLGALDLKLRRQMQIELKWIQTEVGLTFVHVTHDQEEAMTMADTIAVMGITMLWISLVKRQRFSRVAHTQSPIQFFTRFALKNFALIQKITTVQEMYLQAATLWMFPTSAYRLNTKLRCRGSKRSWSSNKMMMGFRHSIRVMKSHFRGNLHSPLLSTGHRMQQLVLK